MSNNEAFARLVLRSIQKYFTMHIRQWQAAGDLFYTVFLYALYRIVLVFRHLFFCNVRAANLLWPETSGLITASRVHGQVSYSDFLNIFSPCLFNRSLNNAANLFPFLFNHEAGKLIIFSRILQFIVCRRGKKSYLQSWARALLPLLPGPH